MDRPDSDIAMNPKHLEVLGFAIRAVGKVTRQAMGQPMDIVLAHMAEMCNRLLDRLMGSQLVDNIVDIEVVVLLMDKADFVADISKM